VAYFLTAHGLIAFAWVLAGWFGIDAALRLLAVPAIIVSVLATSYTGFLFAQGLARDLWQGPQAAFDLLAQAIAEGAAVLLLAAAVVPSLRAGHAMLPLVIALGSAVTVHLLFLVVEHLLTPSPTRHHELASHAIRSGAFAQLFWFGAIFAGGVLPLTLLAVAALAGLLQSPGLAATVAVSALAGSFAWEYVWVEAGQSVPLS
jgi:Ni/Fe-hydrogenase subunit HybB-like protein